MTFALFILYVALSYIQPGEIIPALAPYRVTYWVGMAGLAAAALSLVGRTARPVASLQLYAVIAFTIVMGGSLMLAERWLAAPILTIQRFGPSLAMLVLASCSITTLARLRTATGCVVAFTMMLMLQGAAAYHFGLNTHLFLMDRIASDDDAAADTADNQPEPGAADQVSASTQDDESPDGLRIQALGLLNDPNDLAMALIVALGLVGGAWQSRLELRNLLLGAAAALLVYGVYLTRSRGGAVALSVVLWRFAAHRVGRVPAIVLLLALGVGLTAIDFGGRSLSMQLDESASERFVAWTEGFEMLKSQPLLGVGYGEFLDRHTLTAHNSLVLCFAETGLLGCFLWVGLFVVTLLELHVLKNLPGNEPGDAVARQCAEGLHLALIGFMTAAFFLSRTFVPMLYLIIGLSAALAAIARNAGRSIPLPALADLGILVLACELGSIGVVYSMVKLHVA